MSEEFEGLLSAADPLRPAGGAFDKATEERILDATGELITRLGRNKLSMSDVARSAGVARGTLYRYYASRDALLAAVSKRNADRFFDDLARAMKDHRLLADQLGEFTERIIRSIQPDDDSGSPNNHIAMLHMLATQSHQALLRTATFLRPYIESARDRGEVNAGIDIDDAGEWLARVLLSFTVFQASVSNHGDTPQSVRLFVRRYAITGLT